MTSTDGSSVILKRSVRKAPTELSWTDLVASTAGLERYGRCELIIKADFTPRTNERLVVQIFESAANVTDASGSRYMRPIAAISRSADLGPRDEILISIPCAATSLRATVLAWIEPGNPDDLEFGGLDARPGPHAIVSLSELGPSEGVVHFDLGRDATPAAA